MNLESQIQGVCKGVQVTRTNSNTNQLQHYFPVSITRAPNKPPEKDKSYNNRFSFSPLSLQPFRTETASKLIEGRVGRKRARLLLMLNAAC